MSGGADPTADPTMPDQQMTQMPQPPVSGARGGMQMPGPWGSPDEDAGQGGFGGPGMAGMPGMLGRGGPQSFINTFGAGPTPGVMRPTGQMPLGMSGPGGRSLADLFGGLGSQPSGTSPMDFLQGLRGGRPPIPPPNPGGAYGAATQALGARPVMDEDQIPGAMGSLGRLAAQPPRRPAASSAPPSRPSPRAPAPASRPTPRTRKPSHAAEGWGG
jgi:hypothetical protein